MLRAHISNITASLWRDATVLEAAASTVVKRQKGTEGMHMEKMIEKG
jgi:hypothetical protein